MANPPIKLKSLLIVPGSDFEGTHNTTETKISSDLEPRMNTIFDPTKPFTRMSLLRMNPIVKARSEQTPRQLTAQRRNLNYGYLPGAGQVRATNQSPDCRKAQAASAPMN